MSWKDRIQGSAARVDAATKAVQDVNDRARAAGTHIRDQYDAALADRIKAARTK